MLGNKIKLVVSKENRTLIFYESKGKYVYRKREAGANYAKKLKNEKLYRACGNKDFDMTIIKRDYKTSVFTIGSALKELNFYLDRETPKTKYYRRNDDIHVILRSLPLQNSRQTLKKRYKTRLTIHRDIISSGIDRIDDSFDSSDFIKELGKQITKMATKEKELNL